MDYFLYELEDYALPGFASGTSLYLGSKADFKRLLQNTDDELKELRETFESFCSGKKTIQYHVAYAERRFAYPVKVLARRKIGFDASVYNHTNIWGFPYDVYSDATEIELFLIQWKRKFYIYYQAKVTNPKLEIDSTKQFMELGDNCWGFPGMMKHSKKDGKRILSNNLMLYNAIFSNIAEATDYYNALKNVDMTLFYNEVFGDG